MSVDVTEHGVTCDGVTDDTAALNRLLATLPAQALVKFPDQGTVRITAALSSSVPGVILDGPGCVIKLDPATQAGTTMLHLFGAGQVAKGLSFDTSQVPSAPCVRMRGDYQSVLDCVFWNPQAGGVYIQGARTGGTVRGCTFHGDGYGVLFDSACTGSGYIIQGNVFDGAGTLRGDAIEINTPTGGASDVIVTGNSIRGYQATNGSAGMGIGVANAHRVSITGNVIRDCLLDGIHIEDRSVDCIVSGNTIYNCGRSGVSIQAGTTVPPTGTVVTGNTITACGWNAGTGAIAMEGRQALTGAVITGNSVNACGRSGVSDYHGIDLGPSVSSVLVSANLVRGTIGASTSGVRAMNPSACTFIGNLCGDASPQIGGTATHVVALGNQ